MDAERFVNRRKQCWYMLPLVGEEFDAKVANISRSGLHVTMANGIDGFLKGTIEVDERNFRAKIGGKTFHLGTPVRVRVDRVDIDPAHIELGFIK